jgi:hypothetical protein
LSRDHWKFHGRLAVSRGVKERLVDVAYRRTFPHDVQRVYAWLTDYQDDDHARAGAIVQKRTVLKREGNVVLLEGHNVNLGRHAKGQAEVRLFPEETRWEARIVSGNGRGSVYTYKLTPAPGGHAHLEVHYKTCVRRLKGFLLLHLARPAIKREVGRMWDGFAEAMARDLRAQSP